MYVDFSICTSSTKGASNAYQKQNNSRSDCGDCRVVRPQRRRGGKKEKPTATIEFNQIEVAFIGSAKTGGGTLFFKGKKYPFQIGGLGVGGIGVSKVSGTGQVYRLKDIKDFQGVYGGLRAGIVVVDKGLKGGLWMENTKGVVMRWEPKRVGLALSLGADGIAIELDKK